MYILCYTIDNQIQKPEIFPTLRKAHDRMYFYWCQALDLPYGCIIIEDEVPDDADVTETSAYCTSLTHEKCQWNIFHLQNHI